MENCHNSQCKQQQQHLTDLKMDIISIVQFLG